VALKLGSRAQAVRLKWQRLLTEDALLAIGKALTPGCHRIQEKAERIQKRSALDEREET